MNVGFNDQNGREIAITTNDGKKYVAYGPLDPKNAGGIDVKNPDGTVKKMTSDELLKFIIQNGSPYEKVPPNDTFVNNNSSIKK